MSKTIEVWVLARAIAAEAEIAAVIPGDVVLTVEINDLLGTPQGKPARLNAQLSVATVACSQKRVEVFGKHYRGCITQARDDLRVRSSFPVPEPVFAEDLGEPHSRIFARQSKGRGGRHPLAATPHQLCFRAAAKTPGRGT